MAPPHPPPTTITAVRFLLASLTTLSALYSMTYAPHGFPMNDKSMQRLGRRSAAMLVREELIGGVGSITDASFDASVAATYYYGGGGDDGSSSRRRRRRRRRTHQHAYAAEEPEEDRDDDLDEYDDDDSTMIRRISGGDELTTTKRPIVVVRVGDDLRNVEQLIMLRSNNTKQQHQQQQLAIAISTAPQLASRRRAVRESWARDAARLGVPLRFFVAIPDAWRLRTSNFAPRDPHEDAPSPGMRSALAAEMREHDDVVLCDNGNDADDDVVESSYRALTALTLCAMQYYVLNHQHKPTAILKTDDDAYVNVASLLRDLRASNRQMPWILGDPVRNAKVIQGKPRHPWNNDVYAATTGLQHYPLYFQGAGYVASFDTAASVTLTNHHQRILGSAAAGEGGGGSLIRYSVEDVSFAAWTLPLRIQRCVDPGVFSNAGEEAQRDWWFLHVPVDSFLQEGGSKSLPLLVRWLYVRSVIRAMWVEARRHVATLLAPAAGDRLQRAANAQMWRQMSLDEFCEDRFHVLHHVDVGDVHVRRTVACPHFTAWDGGMERRWRDYARRRWWLLGGSSGGDDERRRSARLLHLPPPPPLEAMEEGGAAVVCSHS